MKNYNTIKTIGLICLLIGGILGFFSGTFVETIHYGLTIQQFGTLIYLLLFVGGILVLVPEISGNFSFSPANIFRNLWIFFFMVGLVGWIGKASDFFEFSLLALSLLSYLMYVRNKSP